MPELESYLVRLENHLSRYRRISIMDDKWHRDFGVAMRKQRDAVKMNMRTMAAKSGISISTLHQLETGKCKWTYEDAQFYLEAIQ